MADHVQKNLERMVPEFEELQTSGMFTAEEVKKIIRKRKEHEYSIQRAGKELVDFLRAIEFELNLSYLIKNRGSRLKVPSKFAYPAVLSRINSLFHSATKVFKGDVRVWLQYIDFTMRRTTTQAAGKIFAEALGLHPNFIPLWISAASWEYFTNNNINAARVLLGRANRLNPQSPEILLEFCRLELAYREKAMLRMDLFGVEEAELKEASIAASDLPKGNGMASGELEAKAAELNATENQKPTNAFFRGDVALSIFNLAAKAFPKDYALRIQFAQIIGSFADTEKILDRVYESIETDFGGEPEAQAFVARRAYDNPAAATRDIRSNKEKRDNPKPQEEEKIDLFAVTNTCVSNFEAALSSRPSSGLYEHYTSFILEILNRVDPDYSIEASNPEEAAAAKEEKPDANSALSTFLRKKAVLVFKESFANSFLTEVLATRWVDLMLALDRLDDALETAEKCANALPSNPLVQSCLFLLVGQLLDQPKASLSAKARKFQWNFDEMTSAFATRLRAVDLQHSATGDLFVLYWNFLLDNERLSHAKSADAAVDELRPVAESLALATAMSHYKRTLMSLRGQNLQTFKLSSLRSALSRWNDHSEESIALVRALYKIGLAAPPTSFDYYKLCINFETALTSNDATALHNARMMFEDTVRDFGANNKDVWLNFIEWESALGNVTKASDLYTRAKRTLDLPEQFISEYNRRLDQATKPNENAMETDE